MPGFLYQIINYPALNHLTVPVAMCISFSKTAGKTARKIYLNQIMHMENQYCKNLNKITMSALYKLAKLNRHGDVIANTSFSMKCATLVSWLVVIV